MTPLCLNSPSPRGPPRTQEGHSARWTRAELIFRAFSVFVLSGICSCDLAAIPKQMLRTAMTGVPCQTNHKPGGAVQV